MDRNAEAFAEMRRFLVEGDHHEGVHRMVLVVWSWRGLQQEGGHDAQQKDDGALGAVDGRPKFFRPETGCHRNRSAPAQHRV